MTQIGRVSAISLVPLFRPDLEVGGEPGQGKEVIDSKPKVSRDLTGASNFTLLAQALQPLQTQGSVQANASDWAREINKSEPEVHRQALFQPELNEGSGSPTQDLILSGSGLYREEVGPPASGTLIPPVLVDPWVFGNNKKVDPQESAAPLETARSLQGTGRVIPLEWGVEAILERVSQIKSTGFNAPSAVVYLGGVGIALAIVLAIGAEGGAAITVLLLTIVAIVFGLIWTQRRT